MNVDPGRLDSAAVAALYAEHAEPLRRFLVSLVRDHQLAADCLQATFAKVVEQGHTAQEDRRKAWLFQVAYNEAMLARRRQGIDERSRQQIGRERQGQAQPSRPVAADSLLRREEVERVRQALDQLPAEQREVVRRKIFEEKTFAVIAGELGIPLGTALARMRAALVKLRKLLGE